MAKLWKSLDSKFKLNFTFSQLLDTGIYIGNNPIIEDDIQKLSNEGISAIINL